MGKRMLDQCCCCSSGSCSCKCPARGALWAQGWLHADNARKNATLLETVNLDGMPYLVMFTVEPIAAGDEILISYSKEFWDGHDTTMKQLHVLAVSPCIA